MIAMGVNSHLIRCNLDSEPTDNGESCGPGRHEGLTSREKPRQRFPSPACDCLPLDRSCTIGPSPVVRSKCAVCGESPAGHECFR
jgi:hypothetical protein